MAFDWTEYLSLARTLASGEDAAQRTAISRAYYAALGKAREFLEREGITFPNDGSVHALVWDEFLRSSEGVQYYIGLDGRGLRNARNAADYDLEFPNLMERVSWALKKAESVLASLQRLQKDLPKE